MRLSIVFSVLLLLAAACRRPEEQAAAAQKTEEPSLSVQTVEVEKKPMPEFMTVTGSLRAGEESELAADAPGKVTSTAVERGQKVKRGAVLVTLDARSTALSATSAEA